MEKLILITALLTCNLSFANDIYCKVVGITDGDTIKCLTDNKKQIKVRLYQIDAPEKKQAFGNKSKQALSDLIFNKHVEIKARGQDKYKRTLGTVFVTELSIFYCKAKQEKPCESKIDVNLKMINQGMAWYYPFAKKNEQYKQAEEQAKKNKVGLWADKAPVAPWEFRKKKTAIKY
ncbi:thermonuclease family protein [Entomomonas moraniae]|uniref:Thermonuclease family protein n=1 Tax=Entomomonas moraniae TaxID=2213226 RepID=A0A3S9XDU9_9GAMM|nr:thermonuclease family protein [Entomomonas moraniae]AZS50629.1 thermonuclease family protein [Entomomonas moraniae]